MRPFVFLHIPFPAKLPLRPHPFYFAPSDPSRSHHSTNTKTALSLPVQTREFDATPSQIDIFVTRSVLESRERYMRERTGLRKSFKTSLRTLFVSFVVRKVRGGLGNLTLSLVYSRWRRWRRCLASLWWLWTSFLGIGIGWLAWLRWL